MKEIRMSIKDTFRGAEVGMHVNKGLSNMEILRLHMALNHVAKEIVEKSDTLATRMAVEKTGIDIDSGKYNLETLDTELNSMLSKSLVMTKMEISRALPKILDTYNQLLGKLIGSDTPRSEGTFDCDCGGSH